MIILSLTALMTSIGLTTSKFAALLGGAALTIGSVIVHSAVGFGLGVALSAARHMVWKLHSNGFEATLQQQYHFDGTSPHLKSFGSAKVWCFDTWPTARYKRLAAW